MAQGQRWDDGIIDAHNTLMAAQEEFEKALDRTFQVGKVFIAYRGHNETPVRIKERQGIKFLVASEISGNEYRVSYQSFIAPKRWGKQTQQRG